MNSDGFTIGSSDNSINENNQTYVGWAWDAGSSNTTISAGSLNSSTYNTSDKWSDDVSGDTYGGASMPKSKLFNGALDNNVIANSGTTLTFSPSGLSSISSLRLYGSSYTGNANGIVINGTDYTSSFPQGGNSVAAWVTIPETSLTSVAWSTTSSGLENGSLYAIEVDGKLLVDNDQTPPDVPSISSTCRTNQTAGFSIVSYTGNGTPSVANGIGHNLNATPELIIVKNRDNTIQPYNWAVFHKDLIDGSTVRYLRLNTADGQVTGSGHWRNTPPTSSVFYVGNDGPVNDNGDDYIAYCFAPVEGYSAFKSHTVASGTNFVYLGLRPRFVMLKRTGSGTTTNIGYASWAMFDTERDTYNQVDFDTILYANRNYAEGKRGDGNNSTGGTYLNIDILSNGIRFQSGAAEFSQPSDKIIICAWAEHPFKTARAR